MAKIIWRGTGSTKMGYSDFTHNGKRIRRALSPYKLVAEKLLQDLLSVCKAEKTGVNPKNVSWVFLREKVLQYYKENRSAGTYYTIKAAFEAVEKYGRPLVDSSQMTPLYMEDFLTKWKIRKFKLETGMSHLRRLKTAIKWAEARSLIPTQNWTLIKMTPYAARVEYFDYKELDKVVAACKGHWKTAAMLMAYAGLRSGEVRHLEWKDIDFKGRLLSIRAKTVQDADGKMVYWEPKESEPGRPRNRKVDTIDRLERHLQSLPRRSTFVVSDENGDLLRKNTYRRYFGRLTKTLKFKVYAHKFRHTYASFMVSSGVSLEHLAVLMGHKDLRSTQIYAHLMPHARRTAVDQMEASLPAVGAPAFDVIAVGA